MWHVIRPAMTAGCIFVCVIAAASKLGGEIGHARRPGAVLLPLGAAVDAYLSSSRYRLLSSAPELQLFRCRHRPNCHRRVAPWSIAASRVRGAQNERESAAHSCSLVRVNLGRMSMMPSNEAMSSRVAGSVSPDGGFQRSPLFEQTLQEMSRGISTDYHFS